MALDVEAPQRVYAYGPGPAFAGTRWRWQRITADDLRCEGRLNFVLEGKSDQTQHHVATTIRQRAEVETEFSTDREGTLQRDQAARFIAPPHGQMSLDQGRNPLVPTADGIEAVRQWRWLRSRHETPD